MYMFVVLSFMLVIMNMVTDSDKDGYAAKLELSSQAEGVIMRIIHQSAQSYYSANRSAVSGILEYNDDTTTLQNGNPVEDFENYIPKDLKNGKWYERQKMLETAGQPTDISVKIAGGNVLTYGNLSIPGKNAKLAKYITKQRQRNAGIYRRVSATEGYIGNSRGATPLKVDTNVGSHLVGGEAVIYTDLFKEIL